MPYKDKAKQRAFQAKWTRTRRAQWLLANGPCVDCGSWRRLEVDHRDMETRT